MPLDDLLKPLWSECCSGNLSLCRGEFACRGWSQHKNGRERNLGTNTTPVRFPTIESNFKKDVAGSGVEGRA